MLTFLKSDATISPKKIMYYSLTEVSTSDNFRRKISSFSRTLSAFELLVILVIEAEKKIDRRSG